MENALSEIARKVNNINAKGKGKNQDDLRNIETHPAYRKLKAENEDLKNKLNEVRLSKSNFTEIEKNLRDENNKLKIEIDKLKIKTTKKRKNKKEGFATDLISEDFLKTFSIKNQTLILNQLRIFKSKTDLIPEDDYYAKLLFSIINEFICEGKSIISHDDFTQKGIRKNDISSAVDRLVSDYKAIQTRFVRVNGSRKTEYQITNHK